MMPVTTISWLSLQEKNVIVPHLTHFTYFMDKTVMGVTHTAIFILVHSSAVLLHDVSARAADMSIGIAIFPIG